MENSILNSIKKNLGLEADYTAFDIDVIMHTNSAFSTLNQLGIGPIEGFVIEDAETEWDEFESDPVILSPVKTYIYLRVRLIFDPPATSFVIAAFEKQISELEWRLNTHREGTEWADPNPPLAMIDE